MQNEMINIIKQFSDSATGFCQENWRTEPENL